MLRKFNTSLLFLLLVSVSALAAKPVDLRKQQMNFLKSYLPYKSFAGITQKNGVIETARSVDENQTTHVKIKQTYRGIKVWGADAIIHTPHSSNKTHTLLLAAKSNASTMNGTFYQDLDTDLQNDSIVANEQLAAKALQFAMNTYQSKTGKKNTFENQKSELIVFVDDNNKAHWAFHISFYLHEKGHVPSKPNYLLDAKDFTIYRQWNRVKTLQDVKASGIGGNVRMGKLSYDGMRGHLPLFDIKRNPATNICYLQNDSVAIIDARYDELVSFQCVAPNASINNSYWISKVDSINGGYSPNNDAMYAGKIINDFYHTWYKIPPLTTKNHEPMLLIMNTHAIIETEDGPTKDNAAWDPDSEQMFFGDGENVFYPLTSLGVAAHEISHGFTQQHANLSGDNSQSGGIDESFSDMSAQAVEFFATGQNTWQIGPEVFKQEGLALRYLDDPSKDCHGARPAPGVRCSIQHIRDYSPELNVHVTSGIYNRLFYLVAKSLGVRKAFDIMVKANRYYWTESTTFADGVCGMLSAAKDLKYDNRALISAIQAVGLSEKSCDQ